MKRVWIGTLAVLALVAFTRTASAQDANVDKGAKVYADQMCSMCHAIAGKGNAKGALDDIGSKLTAAEIREWITEPVKMAAKAKAERKPAMLTKFASLPKADLDNLVAYLSTLKKK
jgi:cytochrome c553